MPTEPTSDESPAVSWCCGEERSEPELTRLECHAKWRCAMYALHSE